MTALIGCAGTSPASTGTKAQALAAPAPAPGASVTDITLGTYPATGKHSFAADVGQVVVIDAWATWCEPCLRSLPLLQALRRDYSQRGVRVYAVSVDEDRAQIPTFLAAARVQLPVLLDPGALRAREQAEAQADADHLGGGPDRARPLHAGELRRESRRPPVVRWTRS